MNLTCKAKRLIESTKLLAYRKLIKSNLNSYYHSKVQIILNGTTLRLLQLRRVTTLGGYI
ncbi:hypothetical protein GYH30_044068 [Glycine max]|uniref:Uncharacterized protein n=1 Tax=Glycine max TaxID=3847 RepID=K7MF38_SOYBN|nr:hypothetical protein GYH30_044068 [Glycine max]